MPKSKRIRSRKKHDQEIFRHMIRGDIQKTLNTIAKDPEDDFISASSRVLLPKLRRRGINV